MQGRFLTWLIVFAAVLATASAARAGNGDTGYYLGLRAVGAAYAEVQDTKATGFSGTLRVDHDFDQAAGPGIVLGYRWNSLPIRTEIEISYRYRFDYDVTDVGTPTSGYKNNLATLSGVVNAAYEYRNKTDFTPYIGGTLGWAQNHSVVRKDNQTTGVTEDFENRTHNLAWGALLGVTWRFARNWDADVAYRYINLGEVDTGESGTGGRITADNYVAHDLLITVDYRF